MYSRILTLCVLFFSLGCAQPKYIQSADSSVQGQQTAEAKLNCDIRFSQTRYCLSWFWEVQPTSQTEGSLIFKIYRQNAFDQSAIVLDSVNVPNLVLWMPSMGHGSTPTTTSRLDVGTYRAANVFFIMPGEWILKFQIMNGSEVSDEAVVQITL